MKHLSSQQATIFHKEFVGVTKSKVVRSLIELFNKVGFFLVQQTENILRFENYDYTNDQEIPYTKVVLINIVTNLQNARKINKVNLSVCVMTVKKEIEYSSNGSFAETIQQLIENLK